MLSLKIERDNVCYDLNISENRYTFIGGDTASGKSNFVFLRIYIEN